jgi:hypothetical protein
MIKRFKIFLFVAIVMLLTSGCSSHNDAVSALTAAGYTNIQTHGHAFFTCSEDDAFATEFTATGPNGQHASGAVCSGWFKGKTIRLD